jgi:hypothetical protein
MLVCASLRPLRNEETIMNQIDVMKQAVMLLRDGPDNHVQEAVDLLCQAIEQAGKVEPVAWVGEIAEGAQLLLDKPTMWDAVELYTHPPTAPAQPVLHGLSLAVIGLKHFGNPIPQEWYAAAKELLSTAPAQPLTCAWTLDDEESGTWASSCGELWSFIDGGPDENRVSYCHHCGGKVIKGASL